MNFNKPVQLNFQKIIFFPVENSEACIFMTIILYNIRQLLLQYLESLLRIKGICYSNKNYCLT